MSYLFIDSTYDLSLGVLDDGLRWLSFENHSGQKASAIIQEKAFELLLNNKINPKELQGIITVNGPGFYTGLRLAEGFADVFTFFGVAQYAFYSYEVPRWCGFETGTWFTKAYRGEYFLYRWNKDNSSKDLVQVKDLESVAVSDSYFIHSQASLDSLSLQFIKSPVETSELIKASPEIIFKEVLKGGRKEPFYFRAPEDEFKVNP